MDSKATVSSNNTKLKADIAEYAAITHLLRRGYSVLKPVGDRLPYDLAIDVGQQLLKIQVKSAWFRRGAYHVDSRRTKTNRKFMKREKYQEGDFDFAFLYIEDSDTFYIMPFSHFMKYRSGISLIEGQERQRNAKSAPFIEAWNLLPKST